MPHPLVRIVTDSTAALPQEVRSAFPEIAVVPLSVLFGSDSYREGIDIQPEAFYRQLMTSPYHPTTSQPSPGDFLAAYQPILEKGAEIISVHISSFLSGTVASALAARGLADGSVEVLDSQLTAMGLGFLALEGARLARQGKDRRAILQRMQSVRQGIRLYFLVDTLEFLRRGGRIGGTQALVGSILQVKPILTITNGRIEVAEKVPGKKRAYARLLQTVGEARKKHPEAQIHLAVHEGGAPEAGRELQRRLEGLLQPVESYCSPLGCALGVHAGPGLVGCVYYLEEDGQVVPAEEVG